MTGCVSFLADIFLSLIRPLSLNHTVAVRLAATTPVMRAISRVIMRTEPRVRTARTEKRGLLQWKDPLLAFYVAGLQGRFHRTVGKAKTGILVCVEKTRGTQKLIVERLLLGRSLLNLSSKSYSAAAGKLWC